MVRSALELHQAASRELYQQQLREVAERSATTATPPPPRDRLQQPTEAAADAPPVRKASTPPKPQRGLRVNAETVLLQDVTSEQVKWLWPARIPLGKLTILDGDPGLGKSLLGLDLAARVSTGRAMPDGSIGDLAGPAGVVLLSAEDGLSDTIKPRLTAVGADCSRITALTGVKIVATQPDGSTTERSRPPFLADIEELRQAIAQVNAQLVEIDPLMAYVPPATDSHRDQDVRVTLAPLAKLAEETGAAILMIRHLNKTGGGNPLYRGGGSIGIIAAVRSGLLVAKDPEDPDGRRRVLAATKCNLTLEPESLSYQIVPADGAVRVEWLGSSTHKASDLLADASGDEDRTALADAEDFLRQILADGEVEVKTILAEASAAGVAQKTLRRAKRALGVRAEKSGFHQGWTWTLEDGQKTRRWPTQNDGHLRQSWPPSEEEVVEL